MHAIGARPFRLVGESAVRAVRNALLQATSAWASDWGLAPALVDIGVQRAWDSASARVLAWNHSAQTDGRQVWLAFGPDLGAGLQQMIFAADTSFVPAGSFTPGLASEGARQALESLMDALVRTSLSSQYDRPRDAAAIPEEHWKRGSGALVARLAIGKLHCHVLLDGVAVQALLIASAPLPPLPAVDVEASVFEVPVTLRLEAGTARVGLGALLSLAPGDVIRLERQADAPLTLSTLSGDRLFGAYLGKSGDGIAVELVNSHTQVGEVK